MNTKTLEDAKQLWSLVLDTSRITKIKSGGLNSSLMKMIKSVSETSVDYKTEPRPEVILVAKFIANIEPSYKNSNGQYVELSMLRSQVNFGADDLKFICEKIESVVKDYISVGSETIIVGQKLKIESKMYKKKLIHAAVMHLLNGSEIFKSPSYYHELKARSLFIKNIKVNYAWMIGLAIALQYPSVIAMMEDMCLKFIDQTNTVNLKGQVVFYDGTIRTENL